jgi:hypothetical protein
MIKQIYVESKDKRIAMNERTIRIKIKLDIQESTIEYIRLQEEWENEGGAFVPRSGEGLVPGSKIPFAPGDRFRVVNSAIDLINSHFYYIADIQKISDDS